jgi:hypothetical protein
LVVAIIYFAIAMQSPRLCKAIGRSILLNKLQHDLGLRIINNQHQIDLRSASS